MLAWAAAYVVVALMAAVIVLSRREPTVVRGDWVFLLTSLFVLLAASVSTVRGERFSFGVLGRRPPGRSRGADVVVAGAGVAVR